MVMWLHSRNNIASSIELVQLIEGYHAAALSNSKSTAFCKSERQLWDKK